MNIGRYKSIMAYTSLSFFLNLKNNGDKKLDYNGISIAFLYSCLHRRFNGFLKNSHFRDILKQQKMMWGENMAVTYKKLFHLLIDRGVQPSELTELAGFSANILTRLRREQYVSLESIERICRALNCKVDDILEFVTEENFDEGCNENQRNGEAKIL